MYYGTGTTSYWSRGTGKVTICRGLEQPHAVPYSASSPVATRVDWVMVILNLTNYHVSVLKQASEEVLLYSSFVSSVPLTAWNVRLQLFVLQREFLLCSYSDHAPHLLKSRASSATTPGSCRHLWNPVRALASTRPSLPSIKHLSLRMASSSGSAFRSTATPLPSPSAHQHNQSFFFPPQRQRAPTAQPQRQPQSASDPQTPAQSNQPQQQHTYGYGADVTRGGPGDSTASSPFLKDFNLVAEAAKRAQMAVLMRDLGDVAL